MPLSNSQIKEFIDLGFSPPGPDGLMHPVDAAPAMANSLDGSVNQANASAPSAVAKALRATKYGSFFEGIPGIPPPDENGIIDLSKMTEEVAAPPAEGLSLSKELGNAGLALGTGVTSGVSIAASLLELVAPETGDGIRRTADDWTNDLTSKMSPEWQAAINKSWLNGDAERDPRAWAAGILQTVPYMIGTSGVGEVGALGLRALGVGAKEVTAKGLVGQAAKQAAMKTSRELAYGSAGAAAGAGEAAQGAAQYADQAGLTPEQRQQAMVLAAPFGGVAGAFLGRAVEGLAHEGANIGRRLAVGAVGEGVEEAGTQTGTEVGKASVGGDFSIRDIANAAVGGVALGGAIGVIGGKRAGKATPPPPDVSEAQAIIDKEAATQRAIPSKGGMPDQEKSQPVAAGLADLDAEGQTKHIDYLTNQLQIAQNNLATVKDEKTRKKISKQIVKLKTELDGRIKTLQQIQPAVVNPPPAPGQEAVPPQPVAATNPTVTEPSAQSITPPELADPLVNPPVQSAAPNLDIIGTAAPLPDNVTTTTAPPPTVTPPTDQELAVADANIAAAIPDDPLAVSEPATETAKIQRRQRAKAGVGTRAQNKTANADPRPDTAPQAGGTKFNSSGSAEAQAVLTTVTPTPSPPSPATQAADAITNPTQPPVQPSPGPTPPSPGGLAVPAGEGAAAPGPVQAGPGQAQALAAPATVPGPAGPLDPQVPPTHPQRGFEAAPTTLNTQEVVQQTLAQAQPAVDPLDASVNQPQPPTLPAGKPKIKKPLAKQSPAERLENILADGEPKQVGVVLAAMQDAYKAQKDGPAYRLISALRGAFPNSRKNPLTITVENRPLSNGFQGLFDPKVGKIYIDMKQAEDSVVALLHEAVHAATIARMRLDPKYAQTISRILADAKDKWDELKWIPDVNEVRGFNSNEEFISEVLTKVAFSDEMDALPVVNDYGKYNFLQRTKNRIKDLFGVRQDPPVSNLFDALLQFIPDGQLIQDGNIVEVRAKLAELGLLQPNALFTSLQRALLRRNQVAGVMGGSKRVIRGLLKYLTLDQIARSYGRIGLKFDDSAGNSIGLSGSINNYYEYTGLKYGYSTKLEAQASRSLEVYKNAVAQNGSEALDNLLVDARLFSLWPNLGTTHAQNIYGYNLPGGPQAWRDLKDRWDKLSDDEKNAFLLTTHNAQAERSENINQLILQRLRGLKDAATADQLEGLIYSGLPGQLISNTFAGVTIDYHRIPTAQELSNFTSRLPNMTIQAQRDLADKLVAVVSELGVEQGPYVPLRRYGEFYTYLETTPQKQVFPDKPALDAWVAQQRTAGDDLNITNWNQRANGSYSITYNHKYVSAHDTERASEDDLAKRRAQWAGRATPLRPAAGKNRSALRREHAFDLIGLTSASIQALRKNVEDSIPGSAGRLASDQIFKFFLESLPDTSIRKSQIKAQKISGASRDMLHVLSNHAKAAAYTAAQLKFGHKLSRILNTDIPNDVEKMQNGGAGRQAVDLTALGNHLQARDKRMAEITGNDFETNGFIGQWWNTLPQIASAWVLTGPGTAITNAFQPIIMTLPHLSATHGSIRATGALMGAYKDVIVRAGVETIKEGYRFGTGVPGAVRQIYRKQQPAAFRDPVKPFFRHLIEHLSSDEIEIITDLANNKKIDFGVVADISALAKGRGRVLTALGHAADGAFILPQAVETVNRVVTGLASIRLNQAEVNADRTITDKKGELAKRAARDIDRTQWNYSQYNKPLAFTQYPGLRAFLTFKTYPQAVFYTVMRNIMQSFNPDNPGDRAKALKTLAGITMGTMAVSGMMGILSFDPFYLAAVALAAMFGEPGEDPEELLRRHMRDWNTDLANLFLKGGFYAGNLGDTQRMGLPQFFPLESAMQVIKDPNVTFAGASERIAGAFITGAPGSITNQAWGGARLVAEGRIAEGLSQFLPKAFMLQDAARAYTYANLGVTDSRGFVMQQPKDISLAERITRALGFEPPEIARLKADKRSFYAQDTALTAKKQDLLQAYGQAVRDRKQHDANVTLREITSFNHKHPGYAIMGSSLRKSIRGQALSERNVETYGVNARTRGQRELIRQITQLQPD